MSIRVSYLTPSVYLGADVKRAIDEAHWWIAPAPPVCVSGEAAAAAASDASVVPPYAYYCPGESVLVQLRNLSIVATVEAGPYKFYTSEGIYYQVECAGSHSRPLFVCVDAMSLTVSSATVRRWRWKR